MFNLAFKLVIDKIVQVMSKDQPHTCAEDDFAQRKNCDIPQCEPHSDGKFSHTLSSERIMYPTPRTVCISFGRPGRSTLLRSRCMKASSVFPSISLSKPQTASMS